MCAQLPSKPPGRVQAGKLKGRRNGGGESCASTSHLFMGETIKRFYAPAGVNFNANRHRHRHWTRKEATYKLTDNFQRYSYD